ncbi:MAG: hypothetical protein CV081_05730 [Nitrospira sp. LK265]|nr:DUF2726 domain-containing protein [Nitrospira sp.]NGZ59987.1 hypothetical protein [Nitrospira sp. LK265]
MKILLAGAVIAASIGLWRYLRKERRRMNQASPFTIPHGTTISSVRLLAQEEVALYSLLQMAVQERYLVLSQVPLWSFVEVEAGAKVRSDVLRQIALKRVDFVLVHPGSCHVEQVVQIEHESSQPHQIERQQVIESVLDAAGIKLTKLSSEKSYSLPDLAAQLGITAEE